MATVSEVRADLRLRLEEVSARMWSDAELLNYLNEAQKVVARRSETILSFNTSIVAVVGTQKYSLPTDVIRVHRVEFVPTGSTQIYPMTASTDDEMDNYWGINQAQQSSYPSYYTIWGTPGFGAQDTATEKIALKMKVYPVPAQAGTFNIYYYRLPATLTGDTSVIQVVAGWEDLVIRYAEYLALLKDRDQRWKEVKTLFEEDINDLVNVTRQWHDQERVMQMPSGVSVPMWLYGFGD